MFKLLLLAVRGETWIPNLRRFKLGNCLSLAPHRVLPRHPAGRVRRNTTGVLVSGHGVEHYHRPDIPLS